jgi:hypothetical protein
VTRHAETLHGRTARFDGVWRAVQRRRTLARRSKRRLVERRGKRSRHGGVMVPSPATPEGAGSGGSPLRPPRHSKLALSAILAAFSVFATLLALEVALRLYHGQLFTLRSQLTPPPNRAANPLALYDAELGWVPRPGAFEPGPDDKWSVGASGLRNNGNALTSAAPPIVVVGDSFTFGDEVQDHETWPAELERLLGVPVLNGGVFAYGVDQAFLRASRLIEAHHPATVVLAFISDDITRAEFAYYSGWKPYFAFENGQLTLKNVPVPEGLVPTPRLGTLRKILSYSFVSSALLRRLAPGWWNYGTTVRAHRDGERVAAALFERLNAQAGNANARFVLVALGTSGQISGNQRVPAVLDEARRRGIEVLDLVPEVESLPADSQATMFMRRGHYSPPMNARIAARIADHLRQTR